MVYIISHRGNLNGPDPDQENLPSRIIHVLSMGLQVEIDVWVMAGDSNSTEIYLGHDKPQYLVSSDFIRMPGLWLHCKNVEALALLSMDKELNYFWHQNDDYTITSQGYIWTLVGKPPIIGSICVLPEVNNPDISGCCGVCTDYPLKY